MKIIKYFFEFIFIYILLIIFKIIGYKNASNFGAIIGKKIGPLFRSNSKIQSNLENSNIGISEEDMPHVFERFYKVDKSRSDTGTGLGLSIAKHILENHQGNIVVNSNVNDGSEFIITLPLDKTNITP